MDLVPSQSESPVTSGRYLIELAKKYSLNQREYALIRLRIKPVLSYIKSWANKYLISIIPSGSFAKRTVVRGQVDIDLLISLKHDTPGTLKSYYDSLFEVFSQLGAVRQNVSIGIKYDNLSIDLVPARSIRGLNLHSIYVSKQDTWMQTNVMKHISIIERSPHRHLIILFKLWRKLHDLDFPSFLLELAIIEAMQKHRGMFLEKKFINMLKYLESDFVDAVLVDPANSNNVISESLTLKEKERIRDKAGECLEEKYWENIIWGLYEKKEQAF
jgi:hypothetical protein